MTEHEICRYCGGTGKAEVKASLSFPVGSDVWWNTSAYGYENRIPATVVAHSKSGKTVRLRFQVKNWLNPESTRDMVTTASPRMLEMRDGGA